MHAADVTQTVHYLLLKTGMVVSRPSQRQPSCWQSAGPRWAHRHRFVLVWTHRVLIQVNFIHATPWMWLTAAAGLIAALPDMQPLFLLGRHMSNSLSKKKKKARFRWSFYWSARSYPVITNVITVWFWHNWTPLLLHKVGIILFSDTVLCLFHQSSLLSRCTMWPNYPG